MKAGAPVNTHRIVDDNANTLVEAGGAGWDHHAVLELLSTSMCPSSHTRRPPPSYIVSQMKEGHVMTRTSDSTGIAIYSIMLTMLTLAWVYIPA
jgi:hypothetical protein